MSMTSRTIAETANGLKALFLVAVVVFVTAACTPQQQEARMLLEDIQAGDQPSALKSREPPPEVAFTQIDLGDGQSLDALIVRPGGATGQAGGTPDGRPATSTMILVPGLAPEGLEDPRLRALASSLARVGFEVVIPELPGTADLVADRNDPDVLAEVIAALTARPGSEQVILAGVSYALGPAVLAATRPEVAPRTAAVFGVGGYYDIETAIGYLTTGMYRDLDDTEWREGVVDEQAVWRYALANADRLQDGNDAEQLRQIATLRLEGQHATADELVDGLGAEGRPIHDLLANDDPEAVPRLIGRLPTWMQEDLRALSPADRTGPTQRVRMILIHGRDDPLVPAPESERLANALGTPDSRVVTTRALGHVGFQGGPGFGDQLQLLGAATDLLSIRDVLAEAS